jgi:hypothetical protein
MYEQQAAPQVRLGEWISTGWEMFAKEWTVWVPAILIMFVIEIVVSIPGGILSGMLENAGEVAAFSGALISIGSSILNFLVSIFFYAGALQMALKQMQGERIALGDIFSGSDRFFPLAGAYLLVVFTIGLVSSVLIVPTLMALRETLPPLVLFAVILLEILPGLILLGLFFFSFPLIVDRKAGVLSALQQSFGVAKQNIVMFTLMPIVIGLVSGVGVFLCCVGLLVTYPLMFTITAAAYRDLFGLRGAAPGLATPSVEPAYSPQAYNQQSWANQPPPSYPPAWGNPAPPVSRPQAPPPMISPRQFPPQPPAPQQPQPPAPPRPFEPPPPPAEALPPTQVMPPPGTPPAAPPSEQPAAGTTSCPHCRAVLQRAARFCNYCGQPLAQ